MADEVFDPLEAEPIARKKLVLFYLIDVSGSMEGDKIGVVNQVMEEVIPEIRNVGGADSDIYLAVLKFGMETEWMYSEPQSIETFSWSRLDAGGMTPMGEAFRELNRKMSRGSFLSAPHLSFAPVVFMLTDGYPTDDAEGGLRELKENKWFRSSLKIALGVGDFDESILCQFTGNPELVLKTATGKDLARLIRFAAISSSTIGSRSMGYGAGDSISEDSSELKEKAFIQMKKDALGEEPTIDDLDMDDSGW
jgi:uncharacterized protein YegL